MRQPHNHSFTCIIYPKASSKSASNLLLYARITVNGLRSEFSIQRSIERDDWDNVRRKAKGNSIEARRLNSYINEVKAGIVDINYQLKKEGLIANSALIKKRYLKLDAPNNSLLELFAYHEEHHFPKIKEGTKKHFRTLYRYSKEFLKVDLKVNDIFLTTLSYSYLVKFENFLLSKRCPSKTLMKRNSAVKHIQRLKTIINLGIKLDWLAKDPFVSYICSYDKVDRGYLTQTELDTIEKKVILIPRLKLVRDLFVFSCYCGLAYIDAIDLDEDQIVRGIDGDRWIYTTRGKNENVVKVPLLPTAERILDQYVDDPRSMNREKSFPKISNQKLNAYLKEIADICGIKKNISFHLARHTFATTVTLSNGVPIETVSKLLGHTQLSTTQIYARVLDKKISSDMKDLKSVLAQKKNENSNPQEADIRKIS
jgi:site-specific recombinase XerD